MMKLFLLIPLAVLLFAALLPGGENENYKLPRKIPCIVEGNHPLMFLTLGNPEVPVKQGDFHPYEDKVVLNDGRVIEDYYRKHLGMKYFEPIDKIRHRLPPTGWCSWYCYFQKITQLEILRNARWIAENLKDHGLEYIQVDDGWQGVTSDARPGGNRDWTRPNEKFGMGMERLASEIRKLGLKPGLWLSPQGQSSMETVDRWKKAFLLDREGKSASTGFFGTFIIDPSTEEAHAYLRDLFTMLNEWGYGYYKIDGQPTVLQEFRDRRDLMRNPGDPDAFFRETLQTIKDAAGPERFLLGCWGTVEEGLGILDGCRTGGDTGFSGEWYRVALRATMKYLFLHNIGWYSDPDVMLARSPMPFNHAKVWATLQGLSGQALLLSDRMYDLPADRVALIKRVLPAVDIRPVDLYPHERLKTVWDLKIAHLGRRYDVVGVFNFIEPRDYGYFLRWEELGLDPDLPHHVFDFWEGEYLGAWKGGIYVKVAPRDVKVLLVEKAGEGPMLVSTDRHVTQGWVDLVALERDGDLRIKGRSRLLKNDPYRLYFASPLGKNLAVEAFECPFPHEIRNHDRWASVTVHPEATREIDWECRFEKADPSCFEIEHQAPVTAVALNPRQVELKWYQNPPVGGHIIRMDGVLLGYTPMSEATVTLPDPGKHTFSVNTVGIDGAEDGERRSVEVSIKDALPKTVNLIDMIAEKEYLEGPGPVARRFFLLRKNQRIEYSSPEGAIVMGGRIFETGIATHARSELVYDLKGLFRRFTCEAGINDDSRKGSVVFEVLCDGEKRYDSGLMKAGDAPGRIEVDVRGVRELKLVVNDGGDGIDQDYANWGHAFLWTD